MPRLTVRPVAGSPSLSERSRLGRPYVVGPWWDLDQDCSLFAIQPAHRFLPQAISWGSPVDVEVPHKPFSSKIRSSKEFLYRSIRHSSAALR